MFNLDISSRSASTVVARYPANEASSIMRPNAKERQNDTSEWMRNQMLHYQQAHLHLMMKLIKWAASHLDRYPWEQKQLSHLFPSSKITILLPQCLQIWSLLSQKNHSWQELSAWRSAMKRSRRSVLNISQVRRVLTKHLRSEHSWVWVSSRPSQVSTTKACRPRSDWAGKMQ